jgi:hypothetical protein
MLRVSREYFAPEAKLTDGPAACAARPRRPSPVRGDRQDRIETEGRVCVRLALV